MVACEILRRFSIECESIVDAPALCRSLEGPLGAVIIADTSLTLPGIVGVLVSLGKQPTWSDIPVVLMSRSDKAGGIDSLNPVVDQLTNVTVIDRPTSVRTLVSAVQAALRARARQYQIRDQMAALSQADKALRLADRRKDEFLATLAHELRNPLAPLRSALQIMELRESQDAQHVRLLAMMNRQMAVMVRLIDDLLDVARISSGKVTLQRQRVDMRKVIQAALEAASPTTSAAGHRVQVDEPDGPAYVMGDATRLAQVIGNLLNNASKYTPAAGAIHVTLTLKPAVVAIEVRDSGVGLPAAVLERVFDMFAQVNRTLDRAQGGLGIGLSLVRRLLEMHGGSIKASSEGLDLGSTFTVTLPRLIEIDNVEPNSAAVAARLEKPSRRLRILIVDDNRDAADVLAMLLEAAGHDVIVAYEGKEALTAAKIHRPRVIFCDIGMPGMSGHEVATRLRADDSHATAGLVALTGWGTEDDRRKAREAGFDFHLTKPVDSGAILALLERL